MSNEISSQALGVTFLSEVINDVSAQRRQRFIVNLRNAIRMDVFDGAPIDHTFDPEYVGRGEGHNPQLKVRTEREYVIDPTDAFHTWFQSQIAKPLQSSRFVAKDEVLSGSVSVKDLAEKYRRSSNRKSKRK